MNSQYIFSQEFLASYHLKQIWVVPIFDGVGLGGTGLKNWCKLALEFETPPQSRVLLESVNWAGIKTPAADKLSETPRFKKTNHKWDTCVLENSVEMEHAGQTELTSSSETHSFWPSSGKENCCQNLEKTKEKSKKKKSCNVGSGNSRKRRWKHLKKHGFGTKQACEG